MSNLDSVQDSMPQGLNGVDLKKQPGPTKQRNDAKWESFRHEVLQFYWEQDNGLKETRDLIKTKYGFKASERKWKLKLNEWNFNKYIPARDMASIVMKGEKRLREEGKETEFFHSGRNVTAKRIRHFKKQKMSGETFFESTGEYTGPPNDVAKTPPNVTYQTLGAEDEDNPSERMLEKVQKSTLSIPFYDAPHEQRRWHEMQPDIFVPFTTNTSERSSIHGDLILEDSPMKISATLELQSLQDSLSSLETESMPDLGTSITDDFDHLTPQIPIVQELHWLHGQRDFVVPNYPVNGISQARFLQFEVPKNRKPATRKDSQATDTTQVLELVNSGLVTKALAAYLDQPLKECSEAWRETSHHKVWFDTLLQRCRTVLESFSALEIELKCRYAYLLVENDLEPLAIEVYRDIIKSLWRHHDGNENDLVAMLIILHCEHGIYMCSPPSLARDRSGLYRLASEISKLHSTQNIESMIRTIKNRGWARRGFPVPDSFALKEWRGMSFLAGFSSMLQKIEELQKRFEQKDRSLSVHWVELRDLKSQINSQSLSSKLMGVGIIMTTIQESEVELDIESGSIEDSGDEDELHGAWSVSDDTKSKYGITYSCSTITGISYSALFVP